MQKIEKSENKKENKKSIKKNSNKSEKKKNIPLRLFIVVIFLVALTVVCYYINENYVLKINKKVENKNIIKPETKEITFENSELKDAYAYSFDDNNIYANYGDGSVKKIYGFDNHKKRINSLIYKEGMLYFSVMDEDGNNEIKQIDLNKGNSKYDVQNLDISYKQLVLLGTFDKYIYYYKSYSTMYENEEYGHELYKYNLKTKKESLAIEGLVSSATISENGKIYYTKSYAYYVNNKTKITKSTIYSYTITDDKNKIITSINFNDYYGNIMPFEVKIADNNKLIYSYQTRDKNYYYMYDMNASLVTKMLEEERYSIDCTNDNTYLICLKNVKDNKKDLLIYSIDTNEKVYESNNVTEKDLESAYVLPNGEFNKLYINLGPNDTTNIFDLTTQTFIEENANLVNTTLKYE